MLTNIYLSAHIAVFSFWYVYMTLNIVVKKHSVQPKSTASSIAILNGTAVISGFQQNDDLTHV